jgi:hypothetical protein
MANNYSLLDERLNRRIGYSDVPHRFVGTFLYEMPFGTGRALAIPNRVVRAIVGEWQLGGSALWQSGFPIGVSGANTGAALARPDRVNGVAIELPQELQGWYDGKTPVTLPSGRIITPPANTYLKYNPDAFVGRVLTTPNGRIVADQFWFGNAAITYDEFRTDSRFNIDLSVRRTFKIRKGVNLEVGADAMNVLNHTQFNGTYVGNLGATVVNSNAALGLVPGMGSANNFGTRSMMTFNPRQIMMRGVLRF